MRQYLKTGLFVLLMQWVNAGYCQVDSLKNALQNTRDASLQYKLLRKIYNYYEETNRDSALYYAEQAVSLAQKYHRPLPEAFSLGNKAYQLMNLGRFAEALQCLLKAFTICENNKVGSEESWELAIPEIPFHGNTKRLMVSYTHHIFGILMMRTENYEQQVFHFREAGKIGREIDYAPRILLANMNLGQSYLALNKPDTALIFEKEAERIALQSASKKYLGNIQLLLGDIYEALNNKKLALPYYYIAVHSSKEYKNLNSLSRSYLRITRHHLSNGNQDSALYYARENMQVIRSMGLASGNEINLGVGYECMYLSYQLNNQFDSAYKYQGLALRVKDSLNKVRIKNLTAFQNLSFQEQLRLQNLEKEKTIFQNRVRTWVLLGGFGVVLLIATILYRNNRQKNRTNQVLKNTLADLKSTQSQLIQSEKMAGLGELTAGIAHEIQNPLNFVNNFSEVNRELLVEMKEELDKGNVNDAKAIANDVIGNQEKITHHGKRADAIVKGMLQHSRSSSGTKEPTDINALADEYLRLAYHGLRAKDKSFNAAMHTDYDPSAGMINIVPQDMGRVILNLVTNAFYAVDQKKKQIGEARLPDGQGYEPAVTVSTRKNNDTIEISVNDNGNGIPQNIIDKVFQPFFTTKPTGQGTGLGLSLSYDIVKAHGGEITVESNEGMGVVFTIKLPYYSV